MIFQYRDAYYPDYIKHGNAKKFIEPAALHFCQGRGVDVGAGKWPLSGATPIDVIHGSDAMALPDEFTGLDFVFSSHCLEHLPNPVMAIEHWRDRLRDGGTLFLYLPHPHMRYWRPQGNRKHLHLFWPDDTAEMIRDLGFEMVINSQRDAYWSFFVCGFKRKAI